MHQLLIQQLNKYCFVDRKPHAKKQINYFLCQLYNDGEYKLIENIHQLFTVYIKDFYCSDRNNINRLAINRQVYNKLRSKFFNKILECISGYILKERLIAELKLVCNESDIIHG